MKKNGKWSIDDWKYLQNKNVYRKGVTISEDGVYFVTKTGKKPIAKNITRNSSAIPAYLFWWKRVHQLEHIHALSARLTARRKRFWDEIARPFMTDLISRLGEKNKVEVVSSRRGDLRVIELERKKKSETDRHMFGAEFKNLDEYYFSWSSGFVDNRSSFLSEIPSWSKPYIPSRDGNRLDWILQYDDDLNQRLMCVKRIFYFCIQSRLDTLAANYNCGDLIQFKINNETFIYQRTREYKGWAYVGSPPVEVDIGAVNPEIPRYF